MNLAPIVLFAYNRPSHVKQTLESLYLNPMADQSDLFIYVDGPKPNASPETLANIQQVKKVIREQQWCKSVTIYEAEKNKGLARSVIEGVTATVKKNGKIIVIEDDVIVSPYFLKFMNDSLEFYKNNESVLSIGSWNYFCPSEKLNENFFLRYPDSIAWATFARAWNLFEADASLLLKKLKVQNRLRALNADSATPYFEKMLINQIEGKVDSWAIRWTATAVLNQKFSFYPRYSLSKHIGFGKGATHEVNDDDYNKDLIVFQQPIQINNIPVVENKTAFHEWKLFIAKLNGRKTLRQKVKELLPEFILKAYRKF